MYTSVVDPIFFIIGGIGLLLVLSNAFLLWFIIGRRGQGNEKNEALGFLQRDMQELSRVLDHRLGESTRMMSETVRDQSSEAQKLMHNITETVRRQIADVTAGVTRVEDTSRQVLTIADQLKNLERVLTHQKQRGSLGEEGLKLVLDNVLPVTGYELQYRFQNGDTVDAVIKVKDGLVPVDAKFSLDNYSRLTNAIDQKEIEMLEHEFKNDLKKRIDETSKYIRPNEGTLPFAFMFIPAEGIFYDLLVGKIGQARVSERSLIEYAYREKNVIIVSPTTFVAYLQSVLYGFRAFQFEESAKEIRKNVEALSKHLRSYDEYFKKVGNSLGTTVNQYNTARKELGKIDKDVYRITGESIELEDLALDGPIKEGV